MINYLYANGDSWTYGNGIDEDPVIKQKGYRLPLQNNERLDYTWPAYLGKKFNCIVKNGSVGGGSNARIVRTTVDFLQKYPKDAYQDLLVIIGWTTLERNEIYLNREDCPEFNGYYAFNAVQPFSSQFPPADLKGRSVLSKVIDLYQKDYVTYIQNNTMDITNYFLQITLMKNLLENLNIKYIFFNAIPWHWIGESNRMDFEKRLAMYEDERFLGSAYPYTTMTNFVLDNKFPLSTCLHPMVAGHEAWGNYLYEKLKIFYPDDT